MRSVCINICPASMRLPTVSENDKTVGKQSGSDPLYAVHPNLKVSSVATWWQMGSCGFHPQQMPASTMRQAPKSLSGYKRTDGANLETLVILQPI